MVLFQMIVHFTTTTHKKTTVYLIAFLMTARPITLQMNCYTFVICDTSIQLVFTSSSNYRQGKVRDKCNPYSKPTSLVYFRFTIKGRINTTENADVHTFPQYLQLYLCCKSRYRHIFPFSANTHIKIWKPLMY